MTSGEENIYNPEPELRHKTLERGVTIQVCETYSNETARKMVGSLYETNPHKVHIEGILFEDSHFLLGNSQTHSDLVEGSKLDINDSKSQFQIENNIDQDNALEISVSADDENSLRTVFKLIESSGIRGIKYADTKLFVNYSNKNIQYNGSFNNFRLDFFVSGANDQKDRKIYRSTDRSIVYDPATERIASSKLHTPASNKLGHSRKDKLIRGVREKGSSIDPDQATIFLTNPLGDKRPSKEIAIAFAKQIRKLGEPGNTLIYYQVDNKNVVDTLDDLLEQEKDK